MFIFTNRGENIDEPWKRTMNCGMRIDEVRVVGSRISKHVASIYACIMKTSTILMFHGRIKY